jgi:sRNA-binding carbon storage regulator CsrA
MGVTITRRAGESVCIDTGVGLVTVSLVKPKEGHKLASRAVLHIQAPQHMPIWRGETPRRPLPPLSGLSVGGLKVGEFAVGNVSAGVGSDRLAEGRLIAQPTEPVNCADNRQRNRQVEHCEIPGCPVCEAAGLRMPVHKPTGLLRASSK